ncbi:MULTISPECIES: helix-turn-helix domain-containing protein [unclassified Mesorhizobium]|uniref:helix-turn-helix domain-containing protein n=1 Tax=unclassified Mesorhizobium TaxID=325217 RepID=UPI00067F0EBE|nr:MULTISPECIES: helix-turn-helix domain-containing protein [unclassified Mesorhizobium]WJI76358.1 helix-turn-helix domain-containing protein [Mesorhizobium sp. C395A]
MISRDEFIAAGWSQKASVSAQVVDVHMSQSRKLLKQSSRRVAIRADRLAGYSRRHCGLTISAIGFRKVAA